jgi:hypothetical protein
MWVLSNMEAVADVRFLGARKLTSHVMNYEAASVVAEKKKIGAVAPTASVLLLKGDTLPSSHLNLARSPCAKTGPSVP